MFISKAELEAIKFASTDETRPISGLYVTETQTIATDGHRLMVVERGDVPEFGDILGLNETPLPLPCIISRQSVMLALKAWPKVAKRDQRDYHQWVQLTNDSIVLVDESLKHITLPLQSVPGQFPNWAQVMPKEDERPHRIGLNLKYLLDSSYMVDNKSKMLGIHTSDENDSTLLLGRNDQGQSCRQVIMRMIL